MLIEASSSGFFLFCFSGMGGRNFPSFLLSSWLGWHGHGHGVLRVGWRGGHIDRYRGNYGTTARRDHGQLMKGHKA